ncbi:altered inheritance of mitochondria protein 21 [Coniella lustricola]|uniref:Altered inheritance of mitochondria protein 21 n=1 Tax=Coniella lustricola TaxID=2025994 RepID=A0A2T3AGP9_9PEZI|nr:altered inheritance of mitochondria protein 21 [Coniella lustricola]
MSTAATQQQPPAIPPRPGKGQEQEQSNFPKIPPRPIKRAVSPNPDRYAPSPLNGGIPLKTQRSNSHDPIERSKSVEIPNVVGEEGMEYAALAEQLPPARAPSTSPTQTRTIDEHLKIHAPKATMPALSAKQRIQQVTRTDSDNAASFGIGKPSSDLRSSSSRSLKKKASVGSGLSHSEAEDEEHGIPGIGVQVPLLSFAGDVQAPSPAPGALAPTEGATHSRAHKRKSSSRSLPPGSYGLHGHNVAPQDKLEKEYYQKHPELLKLEHHIYQHDRATNFSMSSEKLNKMVRERELHGHGVGTHEHLGTPNEQAAYAAYSEAASRPHSTKPQEGGSPTKGSHHDNGPDMIVVDENNNRRSILYSSEIIPAPPDDEVDDDYRAPILAEDEVRKNSHKYDQAPAVELTRERRGSDYEMEPPRSRPTSRPASLYKTESADMRSTPLEDVIEYEPLFPEDDEEDSSKHLTAAQIKEMKQRFPSRDIWEDAPNSVHYTAEVNTPEPDEDLARIPSREQNETPAHAFARRQEELAEKELTHPDAFLWRTQKPTWLSNQQPTAQEAARAKKTTRFPSRDVWEDTPDSLQLETTVSGPQMEESSPVDNKPQVPDRPQRKTTDPKDKPLIPERPKPKSADEPSSKPVTSDRPKPQVPTRPAKSTAPAASDASAAKVKPAVPARPMGNKIAALQAGFMSDLNKKLGLGPQAPKSREDENEEEVAAEEPKEKAPLTDARKGRARGPQRRAPAQAATAAPKAAAADKPKLTFTTTVTVWSIDPDEDDGAIKQEADASPDVKPVETATPTAQDEPETAKAADAVVSESQPQAEPEAEIEEAQVVDDIEGPKHVPEMASSSEKAEADAEPVETKTKTLATSKLASCVSRFRA